jgi:hypothetical protein
MPAIASRALRIEWIETPSGMENSHRSFSEERVDQRQILRLCQQWEQTLTGLSMRTIPS